MPNHWGAILSTASRLGIKPMHRKKVTINVGIKFSVFNLEE